MPKPSAERAEVQAIMRNAAAAKQFAGVSRLWLCVTVLAVAWAAFAVATHAYEQVGGSLLLALAAWTIHLFAKDKAVSLLVRRVSRPEQSNGLDPTATQSRPAGPSRALRA